MTIRKRIGTVVAAGAAAAMLGLAGCADPGPLGSRYDYGYNSAYSGGSYAGPDDGSAGYGALGYDASGYDTLGYDADGVWVGRVYGGGGGWWDGRSHDRYQWRGRDGVAGRGRVGDMVSHDGFGGRPIHSHSGMGSFGASYAGLAHGAMHANAGQGGFFGGMSHAGGGFGGGGHR